MHTLEALGLLVDAPYHSSEKRRSFRAQSLNAEPCLQKHLDKFSEQGLRTLVFAGRELSREEYEAWNTEYEKACLLSEGREDALRQASWNAL